MPATLSEVQPMGDSQINRLPLDYLAESSSQRKGNSLARRRYQKGQLFLRGKRERVWVGRWLEDEILPSGEIVRRHRSEVLGTLKEFPSKRLAQRELDTRVAVVNSPTYRARPTATFRELAERWQVKVIPNHEESTQRSEKSDIKALVAILGDDMVKDINTERVQDVIAGWKGTCSAKTIRNRIATFRLIWDKAKTWNYAAHIAYEGLDLPNYVRGEQPSFNPEDVTRIIAASLGRIPIRPHASLASVTRGGRPCDASCANSYERCRLSINLGLARDATHAPKD